MKRGIVIATGGGACLLFIALYIGGMFLLTWGFEALWNWLVPAIVHGPHINYWESLGILILLSIVAAIFKSGGK